MPAENQTSGKRFFACVNRRFTHEKPSCAQRGSLELIDRLESILRERGIDCVIERKVCLNLCLQGAAMRIVPGGEIFTEVTEERLSGIADALEAEFGRKDGEGAAAMFWPGG
jgi:(2Fe-2S) ferredoxin